MLFCFWGLCWGVVLMLRGSDFLIATMQCLLAKAEVPYSPLGLVHIGMSSYRPRGPVWKHKRWPYWQSVSA